MSSSGSLLAWTARKFSLIMSLIKGARLILMVIDTLVLSMAFVSEIFPALRSLFLSTF